ncbi:hypothetical protein JCM5353_001831 [Sporobolomyces roseus]
MDSQRIRPSLSDLANLDLDAPAFPEWETNGAPAVSVSRTRPPKILSTSIPPPVPTIPQPPPVASTSSAPAPSKPKSRFALQREKEAQEKEQGLPDRFELDLEEGDGGALPKATPRPSLVKDILERPSTRTSPPKSPTAPRPTSHNSTTGRGFPPMGKGVFPRKFDPQPALPGPAFVEPTISGPSPSPFDADEYIEGGSVDGLLDLVSKENENLLKGMSEIQILDEQRQVREEMGLSEGVIRMLEERAKTKRSQGTTTSRPTPRSRPNPPSAPLPPPTLPKVDLEDEEEGTPEYIRRHFFPNEPANPALDWMKPPPNTGTPSQASELAIIAFDLQGNLVTNSLLSNATPPAGSDHHVSSSSTFTIPSLLALTASSVPPQRSTALTTLLRILSHSTDHSERIGEKEWIALRHQCAQKAGWALRDPNRRVVMVSISLLSHLFSSELSSPLLSTTPTIKLENAEEPKTLLSSFESTDPFPSISLQLSLNTLPRSSLVQILDLLISHLELSRLLSSPPSIDLVLTTPKLLESLVERFIAVPSWPSNTLEDSPRPLALEYLSNLARSSRSRAKEIWDRNLVDSSTMRYLALPPWELEEVPSKSLGYEMFERVIELWGVLARYGIGCEMRTRSSALLEGVFERINELCRGKGEGEMGWIEGLFELMRVWMVASVDPHVTGHDIVWSQVEGWAHTAFEVYQWSSSKGDKGDKGDKGVMSSSFELLSSWVEGSKVNQSWRGEKEREWIREKFEKEFEQGGRAIERVRESIETLREGRGTKEDARFIASTLRLSQAYEETSNPPTPALFKLDSTLVQHTIDYLIPLASNNPDYIQLILLLLPSLSPSDRFTRIIAILPLLEASDAVAARDLVDQFLSFVSSPSSHSHPLISSSLHPTLELPSLVDARLLRPFYLHSIVTSSQGKVVGPSFPTPRDVKLTSSLPPFSSSKRLLSTNWTLSSVLDELLRSGSSEVLNQKLPNGWNMSELQLVKTSLVLSRITSLVTGTKMGASEMCYDLIKVFMLEKQDNQPPPTDSSSTTPSIETDLFRHASISHSLSQLLKPYTASQLSLVDNPSFNSSTTLEQISSKVSTAPFYQLYTDFLSLYDSTSFGHHLPFSQLVLVPTSQRYPLDYRRLLWTDYGHLLKTLDIDVGDAVCEGGNGIEEYYEGGEEEEEEEVMLRAYFEGLRNGLNGKKELGLLGTIAVERLNRAVFKKEEEGGKDKVREKLIKSLLLNEEVGRVVLGWSRGGKELRVEEKEMRVGVLIKYAGEATKRENLEKYFSC